MCMYFWFCYVMCAVQPLRSVWAVLCCPTSVGSSWQESIVSGCLVKSLWPKGCLAENVLFWELNTQMMAEIRLRLFMAPLILWQVIDPLSKDNNNNNFFSLTFIYSGNMLSVTLYLYLAGRHFGSVEQGWQQPAFHIHCIYLIYTTSAFMVEKDRACTDNLKIAFVFLSHCLSGPWLLSWFNKLKRDL